MDFDSIKEAVIEIKGILLGARIDKVYQLDRYTFLFILFNVGKSHCLILSVLKRSKRFHLLFDRIYKEYLYSSHAVDIFKKQIGKGKIIDIFIYENRIELSISQKQNFRLVVDFSTVNINLFDEEKILLFALHRRNIQGPVERGNNVITISKSEDKISSQPGLNKELSRDFFNERERILQKNILKILRAEEKKVLRLNQKLLFEKEEIIDKDKYRKIGELIKYNLSQLPRGASSAVLVDFNGEKVTIELNPGLNPGENMNAYFKKYKKLKKGGEIIDEKIRLQKKKLDLVLNLKREIKHGNIVLDLNHCPVLIFKDFDISILGKRFLLRLERFHEASTGKTIKPDQGKSTFLQFVSRTGKRILVGRTAEGNEELSLKIARGNDLWFHAESAAGSHVILCYEKNGIFQEQDIMDAAVLALYFSKLRKEKKGSVQYTLRKYLRKPKNAKPGMVIYYNEKTKWVTLAPDILSSLLKPKGSVF